MADLFFSIHGERVLFEQATVAELFYVGEHKLTGPGVPQMTHFVSWSHVNARKRDSANAGNGENFHLETSV